jgi:uncharacterized protein YuzE
VKVKFDGEADAVYVTLSPKPYAFGEDLDHERRIDYAADGTPIGIEFTCVSEGVSLDDVPFKEEIARLLARESIKVFA